MLRDDSDACWLDIVPGVPGRLADGRVAWTVAADGARRLLVASERQLSDGTAEPVTPPDLQVRDVLSVDGDTVLFSGSDGEPMEVGVWAYGPGGLSRVSGDCTVRADGTVRRDGTRAELNGHGAAGHRGVHGATRAGGTTVLTSRSMAGYGLTVTVLRDQPAGPAAVATIGSLAEQPALRRPAGRAAAGRAAGDPHRAAAAVLVPAGLGEAAGPDGPVRRAARDSACSPAPTPT